jgi:hypothetical protein
MAQGHSVEVCTRWPEVFSQLRGIKISKFRRDRITNLAHYTTRKSVSGTSQFTDVCINAGIREPIPFKFEWEPVNKELYNRIRALPGPVVAVAMPRNPMGRTDGFGKEILPTRKGYQAVVDALAGRAYRIKIGAGHEIYGLGGCDLDLTNKTTLTDMFDVAFAVDGFLGFCSNFVPLSESQSKPALFVWARANINAPNVFIRRITPQKVLHRESSKWVFDDSPAAEVEAAAANFVSAMATSTAAKREGA